MGMKGEGDTQRDAGSQGESCHTADGRDSDAGLIGYYKTHTHANTHTHTLPEPCDGGQVGDNSWLNGSERGGGVSFS